MEKIILIIYSVFVNFLSLNQLLYYSKKIKIIKEHKSIIRWRSEKKPIIGGFLYFISFLFSFFFLILIGEINISTDYIYLTLTIPLVFLLGLSDDLLNINSLTKLILQTIIAIFLINLTQPLKIFENYYFNVIISIIFIVWIINAINMLDNIDGLVAFLTLTYAIFFLFTISSADFFSYVFAMNLLITSLFFFYYNKFPSKIFLGDNGSYLIGLILGFFTIKIFNHYEMHFSNLFEKIISLYTFLLMPVTDSLTVIINRILRKQSPFIGSKDHTSHLLIEKNKIKEKYIPYIFSTLALLGFITALLFGLKKISIFIKLFFLICCIFVSFYLIINDYLYYNKNKNIHCK